MCLQLLLGPTLAYNIDITKAQMVVPESEYFSYVIPAVILFIIGLHIFGNKLEGEVLDKERIEKYISLKKDLPFFLIAIGFLASYISSMFSSELAFVIYLLGGLKYVGVFMIIIGSRRLKL